VKKKLLWLLGLPFVLFLAALVAIAWLAHTTSGAAWLLARLPGVQVEGLDGMLMAGEFRAQRLAVTWAGGTAELRGLHWQGLHLNPVEPELHIQALSVDEVRLQLKPGGGPKPAPDSLALPVGLHVADLQIGRLSWAPDQAALTGLQAQVDLPRSGRHEARVRAARWQHLTLSGEAAVDSAALLATRLQLHVAQAEATDLPWTAALTGHGPLAQLQLHAELQAAQQSASADARVQPFAAWPLTGLTAQAKALDLAALHPDWPHTALTAEATLNAPAASAEAQLQLKARNAAAGRWDAHALPLTQITLALSGRPDQPSHFVLQALDAELPGGGRVTGQGQREADGRWALRAQVQGLRPEALDSRAAPAVLAGPLTLAGSAEQLSAELDLAGNVQSPQKLPPLRLRAAVQGQGGRWHIQAARLTSGDAELSASGNIDTAGAAPTVQLQAQLRQFDPHLLWRGTPGSAWARLPGATRLNAEATVDLTGRSAAQLTGTLAARLLPSQFAGQPLEGQFNLKRARAAEPGAFDLDARWGSNRAQASGTAQADSVDARLRLQAPALAEFAPLLALLGQPAAAGKAEGEGELQLRRLAQGWTAGGSGRLTLNGLSAAGATLASAEARWALPLPGSDRDAPLSLTLDATALRHPQLQLDRAQLALQGRRSAHQLQLSLDGRLPPPARVGGEPLLLSARAQGQGRWDGSDRWDGRIASLQVGPLRAGTPALLSLADLALRIDLDPGRGPRVEADPGRAEVAGAVVRWQALAWQGGDHPQARADLELESLAVAPLLARWQPDFGWGGDLRVAGHASLTLTDKLAAELSIERQSGDLRVTDEFSAQALGLTDLRLALTVRDGVWQFAQGFAGTQLGGLGGAITLRPTGLWPDARTPVEGVLQANVAKLSNWGAWVPAGWRLGGQLGATVQLAGTLGAPDLRGSATGEGLELRHVLYGVDVSEGRFALELNGQKAELTRLEARGGDGWLRATGRAELGSEPRAQLQFTADKLRVLSRVDRRAVVSGKADLALDAQGLQLDGQLRADEGLYDFSRADAPSLADDVDVRRGLRVATPTAAAPARKLAIHLGLDFGRDFKVRGRGLATALRGQLQLTQQNGPLKVTGKLSAEAGQYAAYGQKLEIERGDISFTGTADNPALDLLAVRPNLDTRVGVRVTGTAQSPRVALYSEPDMADTDKLSWLLLGRGPDGLGRTDTALLQRAAVALLSGEGEGLTGRAIKGLGLDELSLAQADDDTRATIVRLGKQLSRRWYVGYERSLNATTGSWQLIYRVAQRFTLRAQSGDDNALDLIWQWRWN
jgi:translocation and assembly module TamB